jgi:hypothetical protein
MKNNDIGNDFVCRLDNVYICMAGNYTIQLESSVIDFHL